MAFSPSYKGSWLPASSSSAPFNIYLDEGQPAPRTRTPAPKTSSYTSAEPSTPTMRVSASSQIASSADREIIIPSVLRQNVALDVDRWLGDSPTPMQENSTAQNSTHASSGTHHRICIRPDEPMVSSSGPGRPLEAHQFNRNVLRDSTNMQQVRNINSIKTYDPLVEDQASRPVSRHGVPQEDIVMRLPLSYPSQQQQHEQINVTQPRTFRPMQTKLGGYQLMPVSDMPSQESSTHENNDAIRKMLAGFSPNYKGNINLARNRSADIPASENCALFITGLPPCITFTELLANVRDAGRVYATHLNGPDPERGHSTSAAKLIFFDRRGAERFYDRHAFAGFRIPGHPEYSGRVVWNRIRTAASDAHGHCTRVLFIAGPTRLVNTLALTTYFQSKFDFDIDEVIDHGGDGDRKLIEYRFGSFRCQAEAAKMAITRELVEQGVQAWFGRDPCDIIQHGDGMPAVDATAVASWGPVRQENQHTARFVQDWRQGAAMQQFR